MPQAPHAPRALTHMTNPKITRAPLPALLPTILAGLFILAGCGGTALPIPVIATESTDVADNLESNTSDSILLSVNKQPPVEEEEEKHEEDPAPVFEVAVAPASPPQRSYHTEPVTETETVTPVYTTAPQSVEVAYNTWTGSFTSPALATTADFTGNGFLMGSAIETEHRDADSIFMGADKIINAGRLNLSTATFDGAAIGGDAMDGVVFFRAEKDSQTYNYAGILTGTNLGAPLTVAADTTAEWNGNFYALVGYVAIDTDFTLTVDFSTARTLNAKTYGKRNNYVTLDNAVYDADGVITGGITIRSGANTAAGVLTGLIGADGAVGTFYSNDRGANSYAGGFVANKTMKTYNTNVTASDWTRSFTDGIPIKINQTTTKNEFLVGSVLGRLDETGAGNVVNRGSLNLAQSTYNGVKLGGDVTDGVSFFRTLNNGKNYNYAGLYSGTDLGAPLEETFRGDATANWGGRIRTAGWFNFDTDFILKINFGTKKLNVAELRNPADTDQWLMITDAEYDDDGVISGRILIDEDNDPQGIFEQYGFLTGLIGQEGAVASFISTGDNVDGATTTTGTKEGITRTSDYDYAGGFVASPPAIAAPANPNITIDDWISGFTNTPKRNAKRYDPDGMPPNAFLLRDDPARREIWKKTDGGFLGLDAVDGDATDGVDFFPQDINSYTRSARRNYFAGIWDSTDLGVALPLGVAFNGKTSAEWRGKFSVFQGTNARLDKDFMLTVDFINNSFSTAMAIEAGALDYYLSGNYDADGMIITGRVSRSDDGIVKNGILTGLIGHEGAVGAFVSGSNADKDAIEGGTGNEGYAGGFVAIATPAIATPAIDARDLPNYNAIPFTMAGLRNTATPNRGFLRIVDGAALNTDGITDPVPFTGRRDSTADSPGFGDGYTFVRNGGYAAILPTTDLGLPNPVGNGQATDARWTGTYSLGDDLATNEAITFDINFHVSTLTGTAPLTSSSSNNITIYTTFGPTGVMHGTFSTDTTTAIEAGDTRVIGLIGTEGLVGIMHGQDTAGAVVSGGFVASP